VRSKIILESEKKVRVHICESKQISRERQNECEALPVTTRFGSETKRCVTEFYVRGFPTYSTKKHPFYKAAQVLFAHPVA
jgi:hypothetical protein